MFRPDFHIAQACAVVGQPSGATSVGSLAGSVASDVRERRCVDEESTQRQVGDEPADLGGREAGGGGARRRPIPVLYGLVVREDRHGCELGVDWAEHRLVDPVVNHRSTSKSRRSRSAQ